MEIDKHSYTTTTITTLTECFHEDGNKCPSITSMMVRVFANGPGDLGSLPGQVIPKTQKMVLDASLLNTQHYMVSRVKWSNPGKGVVPSPTP